MNEVKPPSHTYRGYPPRSDLAGPVIYHSWRQIGLIVGEAADLAPESKLGSQPKLAATGKTGQ
jgi:hypothetical protein